MSNGQYFYVKKNRENRECQKAFASAQKSTKASFSTSSVQGQIKTIELDTTTAYVQFMMPR